MHPAYIQGYADIMTKLAEISDADIAAALAGRTDRDISNEEVEEMARRWGRDRYEGASSHPYWGGGIGALLGSGVGGAIGGFAKGTGRAGAIGAGVGALAGGGLGALVGRSSQKEEGRQGKMWGQQVGDIAQQGRVPHEMSAGNHQSLLPFARGIQEDTAQPLTREEYDVLREGLKRDIAQEKGLQGALSGAALGGALGGRTGRRGGEDTEGGNDYAAQLAGAALGGGQGVLTGMQESRRQANQLSDLYERGYGHLAGRLYENH